MNWNSHFASVSIGYFASPHRTYTHMHTYIWTNSCSFCSLYIYDENLPLHHIPKVRH